MAVPIYDLQKAMDMDFDIAALPEKEIKNYFQQNLIISDSVGRRWSIGAESVGHTEVTHRLIGVYDEVDVLLTFYPPPLADMYRFYIQSELSLHAIPDYAILFFLQQEKGGAILPLGEISLDKRNGRISPLAVSIKKEGKENSLTSMILLGMEHIRKGFDHLLFIFTLLIPAFLSYPSDQSSRKNAGIFRVKKIIGVVTAFTIGHSIALLLAASGMISIPPASIEVAIAVTLFISAIHGLYPLYPGKELWVALFFGSIHGLAFAGPLIGLHLNGQQFILALFGFNIGIECMQIIFILLMLPGLLFIYHTRFQSIFRKMISFVIMIVAFFWMLERIFGQANFITLALNNVTKGLFTYILVFTLLSGLLFLINRFNRNPNQS